MSNNMLWYICLSAVSFLIAAYAIYKKRHIYKVSTLIVFYLFSTTISWIGEFTVLGLFNSYEYRIGLFTDPWAQNLLAHLLLNSTMFPAAGILVVAYSLRYKGITVITVVFTLIEYIFLEMGMYEHHWWRYYMSVINTVAFILIARSWFLKMNEKRYGAVRAVTYYFIAMLVIHTHAPVLLLLGKQYYRLDFIYNLAGNYYLSSIIIAFTYHLIESFVLVLFICILKKWYWRLLPFIISPAVQIIFADIGVLNFRNGWSLAYTILIYELCIAAFLLIEKLTLRSVENDYRQIG